MARKSSKFLITHRDVAKLCGTTPRRIREWATRGQWPEPHSVVEQTWFYRADLIKHYLDNGRWPEWAVFRMGLGAGLYRTSADVHSPPPVAVESKLLEALGAAESSRQSDHMGTALPKAETATSIAAQSTPPDARLKPSESDRISSSGDAPNVQESPEANTPSQIPPRIGTEIPGLDLGAKPLSLPVTINGHDLVIQVYSLEQWESLPDGSRPDVWIDETNRAYFAIKYSQFTSYRPSENGTARSQKSFREDETDSSASRNGEIPQPASSIEHRD